MWLYLKIKLKWRCFRFKKVINIWPWSDKVSFLIRRDNREFPRSLDFHVPRTSYVKNTKRALIHKWGGESLWESEPCQNWIWDFFTTELSKITLFSLIYPICDILLWQFKQINTVLQLMHVYSLLKKTRIINSITIFEYLKY
jgi:hypothetical protein